MTSDGRGRRSTELLALAEDALLAAGEAEAEIWIRTRRRGCARFSVGELSQHMGLDEVDARVRVAVAGAGESSRVGEVATSEPSVAALREAIAGAATLARTTRPLDGFAGFDDGSVPTPVVDRWSDATAAFTDAERAGLAARIIDRVASEGLIAAGFLETSCHSVAIATTSGARRAHDGAVAELRIWALDDPGGQGASGHGSHLCRDVSRLEVDREVEAAIRTAIDSRDPGHVDAGPWDVVMEPAAIAELLEWLGMVGAGAPEVEQGTSFLAGRVGERVTGAGVSVVEDPLGDDEGIVADPFDREGTPRRAVALVERGIAREHLNDRVHAARAGARPTGSAVVPDASSPSGVGGVALALDAGGHARDAAELVAGMDRGLYIHRLNYVNGHLEPRRAVMTGLSRDGCFLVERGRIVRPVGNVRMTDSFLEMLARVDGATAARRALPSIWTAGASLVSPAMRFRQVRFSSGSRPGARAG